MFTHIWKYNQHENVDVDENFGKSLVQVYVFINIEKEKFKNSLTISI